MATLIVLKERLMQAEDALHQLMTGEREVTISVGGYGATTFSQVNRSDLERYISQLKSEIGTKEGCPRRRPIFMRF
ncbi:MAG: hypothetical protein ACI9SC_002320 [Gammaproteobacteria bacterium]|jgi:hypothetical protein